MNIVLNVYKISEKPISKKTKVKDKEPQHTTGNNTFYNIFQLLKRAAPVIYTTTN